MFSGQTVLELNFNIYSYLALIISIVNFVFYIFYDVGSKYFYINSFISIFISLVNYSQSIVFTDDLGLDGNISATTIIIIQFIIILLARIIIRLKDKR